MRSVSGEPARVLPPRDPLQSKVIVGDRDREALIEFDNEDDPFKLLCSTCSQLPPCHSKHCVGIDPGITGSFNTWGPGETHSDTWREQLNRHSKERWASPFSISLPFCSNLHICWRRDLQPLHLPLKRDVVGTRRLQEAPHCTHHCHTVTSYLGKDGLSLSKKRKHSPSLTCAV